MKLAVSLVLTEKIVAGMDGESHQPMLEWCLAPETAKALVCFGKNLLHDVLHLLLATGMPARGGEQFRLITTDKNAEGIDLTPSDPLDDLQVGRIGCTSGVEVGGCHGGIWHRGGGIAGGGGIGQGSAAQPVEDLTPGAWRFRSHRVRGIAWGDAAAGCSDWSMKWRPRIALTIQTHHEGI